MDHQLPDGYIPMMIEVVDWPEPYLNMKHKEGILMNMHKPFLCQQIVLISDFIDDYSWCSQYFENLEKYFECYDNNYYFEKLRTLCFMFRYGSGQSTTSIIMGMYPSGS